MLQKQGWQRVLGFTSFPFFGFLWRGVNKLAVVVQTEEALIASEKAIDGQSLTSKVKRFMRLPDVPKWLETHWNEEKEIWTYHYYSRLYGRFKTKKKKTRQFNVLTANKILQKYIAIKYYYSTIINYMLKKFHVLSHLIIRTTWNQVLF